jgi:3-phosphoshikimate 1-carboxyvinyltransferase
MTALVVHPQTQPLLGGVPVPSDKSIGHRAFLLAGIANGTSRISGFSFGADNVSTLNAMAALGSHWERDGKDAVVVKGTGLFGLIEPKGPIDCGNSGTTMRLLAGILVAQPFATTLIGDASLTRRPMKRIFTPLRERGARLHGSSNDSGEDRPPVHIEALPEAERLRPLQYASPIASAQIKSAILLSGLYAHGATQIFEPSISRDHSERMLRALGVPLEAVGSLVTLDPAGWNGMLPGLELALPGDLSAAAFLLAAGLLVPDSQVTVRHVGLNPTRTGFLEVVRDLGGLLAVEREDDEAGEPVGRITAAFSELRGTRAGGETVVRAIDEVPILAALAARASGTTTIRDAQELRVKESDRLAEMAVVLRAFGVSVEELPDGLAVEGQPEGPLKAAHVHAHGDHRIAMTAAVLGLLGNAPTRIEDVDAIGTSFPRFVGTLRALGANVDVVS